MPYIMHDKINRHSAAVLLQQVCSKHVAIYTRHIGLQIIYPPWSSWRALCPGSKKSNSSQTVANSSMTDPGWVGGCVCVGGGGVTGVITPPPVPYRINLVAIVAYAMGPALSRAFFLFCFCLFCFGLSIFFPGPRLLYATGPALA